MKRKILCVMLALLMLGLCACGAQGQQAKEKVESVLGKVDQLPMDTKEVMEQLEGEVLVQEIQVSEDALPDATLVVGSDVILYNAAFCQDFTLSDGTAYTMLINVQHVGHAQQAGEDVYNVHFVGANMVMELIAPQPETVKSEVKEMITGLSVSDGDKQLLSSLVDGEKVYADTSSYLWEAYALTRTELQLCYDREKKEFSVVAQPEYDDMYGLYYLDVENLDGTQASREAYYFDDDGNKWIDYTTKYTYFSDGSYETRSVSYYENSTQIWIEDACLWTPDGESLVTESHEYTDEGVLTKSQYYDAEGNLHLESYDYMGRPSEVRVEDPEGNWLLQESYDANGMLASRKTIEDGAVVSEEYMDGKLMRASKQNGDYTYWFRRAVEVGGFYTGGIREHIYHDDGKTIKISREYDANGALQWQEEYAENGTITYRFSQTGPEETVEYWYNEAGDFWKEWTKSPSMEEIWEYADSGLPSYHWVKDAAGNVTEEHFDEYGQPVWS